MKYVTKGSSFYCHRQERMNNVNVIAFSNHPFEMIAKMFQDKAFQKINWSGFRLKRCLLADSVVFSLTCKSAFSYSYITLSLNNSTVVLLNLEKQNC